MRPSSYWWSPNARMERRRLLTCLSMSWMIESVVKVPHRDVSHYVPSAGYGLSFGRRSGWGIGGHELWSCLKGWWWLLPSLLRNEFSTNPELNQSIYTFKEKLHEKKRWSLVSIGSWQNTQFTIAHVFQAVIRSSVVRRFRIASHAINEYLGVEWGEPYTLIPVYHGACFSNNSPCAFVNWIFSWICLHASAKELRHQRLALVQLLFDLNVQTDEFFSGESLALSPQWRDLGSSSHLMHPFNPVISIKSSYINLSESFIVRSSNICPKVNFYTTHALNRLITI